MALTPTDRASGIGTLMLNGVVVAQSALGSFTPETRYDLYLGHRAWGGANAYWWAGMLDERSIYGRALGTNEIQAIFLAGADGKCAGLPPFVITQPASLAVAVGGTALFEVAASGTPPLAYQWLFNSTNPISGATNASFTLTNVQPASAGTYSVRISNAFGTVDSSNAILTVNIPPSCAPPPAGLAGWWKGEGNPQDSAGGNNGLVLGNLSYAPGKVGSAFVMNGTDAGVKIGANRTLDVGTGAGLTIEGWIKPSVIDVERPIAEWNNGNGGLGAHFWVSTQPSLGSGAGCLYGNLVDSSGGFHPIASASGLVQAGTWQHVALTYDHASGNASIYLNGVPVAEQSLGSFTPQTSYDLYLGHRAWGGAYAYWWTGAMDEVSLYSRALTPVEVASIYAAASAGKCAGIPPFIAVSPKSFQTEIGGSALFASSGGGTGPIQYQWYSSSSGLIAGATNASLALTNLQPVQAGTYTLTVSNAFGYASDSAILGILSRLQCSVSSNQLHMQFSGVPGRIYYVQASTDLIHWFVLAQATDLGGGNFGFTDNSWSFRPQTFYQVIQP
ncbi:MAG: LamG-like jellyroll fold domain-containing protein [Verrucomicrobiota bacterium]